ncbi:MAG: hypothetical protein HYY25_06900 [Candidatus Wallbacteria bacterium]|nr:hypothetical protein [Candidatus Wallbacteria bacterium]
MNAYQSAAAVERLRRALESVARARGGEAVRDNYTDALPRVRMVDADRVRWLSLNRGARGTIRVGLVSRSRLEESEMHDFPSLEMHPAWCGRDWAVPWMRPVEAGDAVLDARFAVYSGEGRPVAHVFNPQVSAAILELHYGFDVPGVDVTLGGRAIVLRKSVRGERLTARLLEEVLARMDVLCASITEIFRVDSDGIVHIDARGVVPADSRCRVCGEPLERATVTCAACETPHHADCWQYLGRCAIFGCGSHRFTRRPAEEEGEAWGARRPGRLRLR